MKHLKTITILYKSPFYFFKKSSSVKIYPGFTFAEVLLTLVIIGIVAILTIPNLVVNIQREQFKSAWKKAYSTLEQATYKLMYDNGGSIKNVCNDSKCLRDLYVPYYAVVKTCDNSISEGCWAAWGPDPTAAYAAGTEYPGLITNGGSSMQFYFASSNCSDSSNGLSDCGVIDIDVNGPQKPNQEGKDQFKVHLQEDGITPFGSRDDGNYCNASETSGCATALLMGY